MYILYNSLTREFQISVKIILFIKANMRYFILITRWNRMEKYFYKFLYFEMNA